MSLARYKKKRSFEKTPEPFGGKSSGRGFLTFVVQRHEASRLHYDFRLELNGVLKSWAVPKGPSMNPDDKRLAMMVEDHPLDYANFEGIIPKGQYGGGTVMVWDRGVYMPYLEEQKEKNTEKKDESQLRKESEEILMKQLKEGHLTFIMLGEKLKGEFALIKMAHAKDENAWLLVKKGDEYASDKDILNKDRSVLTGRDMRGIQNQAEKKKEVWHSRPKDIETEDLPKEKMPHDVKPMLAETSDEPFDRKDWIYEMKWDGYRTIAEIENGKVKLYSRNLQSFDEKFSEVKKSLEKFPGNAVLDGEVVVVDKNGKPNFGWLQEYPEEKHGELIYYIFDILHFSGHNLRKLSLIERKEFLQKVLTDLPHVRYSDHILENGIEFFKQAQIHKLEGIIAKDSKSIYKENSRSHHWLKIKTGLREEAIICGFTKGKGGRKHFGALILGFREKGKLKYIGHCGGGFDDNLLADIYKKLEPLIQNECPFENKPKTNAPVTWVTPVLICGVSFKEWTNDGLMRQPVFLGIREDTDASEAINTEDSEILYSGKHSLKLNNLNKVFWPKEKYTKGDLIKYYKEAAPFILPHLKNRPQSLLRYPNGIGGESFFQKDVSNLKLDFLQRIKITHDHKKIEYMFVSDEASLIYLINLGCIDLNPWNSRISKLDYPDYLVIDLDPLDLSFEKIVEAANASRRVLENLEIESFPKTSGASGIHIYIPTGAKYNYEQVKNFANLLCIKIHEQIPEITSLERSPKKRRRKVYLDYLQNNRGQTLASVYSVRPRPEAPVSTPLKWNEVTNSLRPENFTIKNTLKRLEKHGDLFKGTLEKGINMKRILKKLERSGSMLE